MKRTLDRWFAYYWGTWLILGLAIAILRLDVWWVRGWLIAFVPPELWAAFRSRGGDTLSEFMSWISGWAGEDSKWWQGWNALVSAVTVGISLQAAWAAGYGSEAWDRPELAALVGAGAFLWLIYHWLRPGKHG